MIVASVFERACGQENIALNPCRGQRGGPWGQFVGEQRIQILSRHRYAEDGLECKHQRKKPQRFTRTNNVHKKTKFQWMPPRVLEIVNFTYQMTIYVRSQWRAKPLRTGKWRLRWAFNIQLLKNPGLLTVIPMSAYGYKRTSSTGLLNVRCPP